MSSHQFDAEILNNAKAWPFAEARTLIKRLEKMKASPTAEQPVLFETGYGPSGLPHIGTFGEVVRTSMVRKAFETLTGQPTRLICFSDDMDGLRKVPDNIPNKDMIAPHLGKALTDVPDPFGTHNSFGEHNNARLQGFLDGFGFEYDFFSATECYQSGRFDDALLTVLNNYDAITNVVLPTLGEERRATYSPFMPVCPDTREVLQAEITGHDVAAGTVEYIDPRDGSVKTSSVTGGQCKLQWKCDWAMRWYALGVDYEMSGKDLSESVILSSKITRIMGGTPPEGISYELFLDQNGEKISKSKGNGLSVEEWLTYGTEEALSLFMYNQPKRAKRLFFDVVPKMVDEYFTHLEKYDTADDAARIDNPVWHIHGGTPPKANVPVGFSLLLNLAGVCQAEHPDVIWGYLTKYAEGVSPESHPQLAHLVNYAVTYYQERVHPFKTYRAPTAAEAEHLRMLDQKLAALTADSAAEDIQSAVFSVGKEAGYDPLREWFSCLYQVLLGQNEGPRMGSFIQLYGVAETRALILSALSGELSGGAA
ncbi:MAG: lysine--tRNA ligase [Alphaproteobacteria bacterium]|nr:lysine--tRNA ligase [Alphaproteobacteria bacterium]